MSLNPYHPQRYWTHLVRALFHQGRFEEALIAIEHLDKPRKDDHAYRIAALAHSGNHETARDRMNELRQRLPDFDPVDFVDSMPFQREDDRKALRDPLAAISKGLQ
jgi:adenylate cyclase